MSKCSQKRIANGLCPDCAGVPLPNKKYCQPCLDEAHARYVKRKTERATSGVCARCGEVKATTGKEYPICDKCRGRMKVFHDDSRKFKKLVFENYGGCYCQLCDEKEIAFLSIDHIEGGGCRELRALGCKGGEDFYGYLKRNNYPKGYRVLCMNCNWRKKPKLEMWTNEACHKSYDKLKNMIFESYGGYKCNCCGVEDKRCLTIDHINGVGNKHRKGIKGGGGAFYRWLRNNGFPEGYQVLCMNCQFGRKHCDGVCPHKHLSRD